MVAPHYDVRGDFEARATWSNDVIGIFQDWDELVSEWTWLDLVGRQVPDEKVESIQINRVLSDFRQSLTTGTAEIILDNFDKQYTPAETSADGNPSMKDDKRISIKANMAFVGWFSLFSGTIKTVRLDGDVTNPRATLIAEDDASIFRKEVSIGLKVGTKTDSLTQDVLNGVGYPGPAFIDDISDVIPFSLIDDQSAGTAIQKLKQSGAHFAFVDRRGAFRFKKRGSDSGLTVVDSINEFLSYEYEIPSVEKVINKAIVRSRPRQATTTQQTIAWINNAPPVNAGDTIEFFLGYRDSNTGEIKTPSNSVDNPVSSKDFKMNASSDGTGADLTSNVNLTVDKFARTAKFNVENTSSQQGFLTKCQIRGFPLQEQPLIRVTTQVDSSISKFGENTLEIDNDLIPKQDFAKQYTEFIVQKLKDHHPILRVSPKKNVFPNNLKGDLLESVTVVNSITNVNTDLIINEITHNIEFTEGLEHTVEYGIELTNKPDAFVIDEFTLNESLLNGEKELDFPS